MATTHYIDTSAPEIARARVKSLTQRVPEAFPVLVYGDTRDHNFVFFNSQTGSVESYSGNASYSLRVTLGEVQLGPTSGSYVLTCGSSGTVDALSDASTIEAALNSLTTVISDGGVKVSGTFPNFLVTYNTVGVKTAFTADSTSLVPTSSVSLVITAVGSASVRQQTMIVLRQSAIVSQSTWTTISSPANGWTGTITTATAGALTLLASQGEAVGDFIEVSTCLTAEVLDGSGTPISYYQTPITLRAKNLDPSSSVSPPITGYTLGDILYGKADGTLGLLAGNTSTTTAILTQTGTGVISAIPAWTTTPLSVALGGTGAASLTSTALLLGAGTSAITASNLTYVSPTLSVPDAFTLSSAGSIGLTAGGTNQNVTITPSGTGLFQVATSSTGKSLFGNSLTSTDVATRVFNLIDTAAVARIWRVSADSTTASPAFELMHGTTNLSASRDVYWDVAADTTGMYFRDRNGAAPLQRLLLSANAPVTIPAALAGTWATTSAWGTSGIQFNITGGTSNDTSSSGTVATAVANSLGVPTFRAQSATTFTNAANLYIAGDVTAGTNVTLTNSYGLWNAGKTRLDGGLYFGGTTPGVISGSSGTITLTGGVGTNAGVALAPAGTGTVSIGTAASTTNTISFQSGSALINATNTPLDIKRNSGGTDASVTLWDSTNTAASRLVGTSASLQVQNGAGNAVWLTVSGVGTVTGGAGNMTITAGTGNSRTMALQTTTSGGTATTALTLSATQTATFAQTISTRAPSGGTSNAWALGTVAVVSPTSPNRTIEVEIGGTTYYIAAKTTNN